MSKITLSSGFTLLEEGEHIFKITDCDYDEKFGKMVVKLITAYGEPLTETFAMLTAKGDVNLGAVGAFSYLAKAALNNSRLEEIDHADIIGHYIRGVVKHDVVPSRDDPSKEMRFPHLKEKYPVSGFENENTGKRSISLDDLLK